MKYVKYGYTSRVQTEYEFLKWTFNVWKVCNHTLTWQCHYYNCL